MNIELYCLGCRKEFLKIIELLVSKQGSLRYQVKVLVRIKKNYNQDQVQSVLRSGKENRERFGIFFNQAKPRRRIGFLKIDQGYRNTVKLGNFDIACDSV